MSARRVALALILLVLIPVALWLNADTLSRWYYNEQPLPSLVDQARRDHGNLTLVETAGERLLETGKPVEAVELVLPVLDTHPERVRLLIVAGRAVWQAGDPVRGGVLLRSALQHSPVDPDANYWMAELLYSRGYTYNAESLLKEVVRLEPGRGLAWCRLGEIALQDEHYAEALQLETRAEKAGGLGGSTRPYLLRAAALKAVGRIPEAEAAAKEAVKRQATPETLTLLGEITLLSPGPERLRAAQGLFERAAEQSTAPADILKLLAINHRTLGELPQAVRVLRRMIRAEPTRPEGYLLLGQTYGALGRKALAERCLTIYHRLEPQETLISRARYRVNNAQGSADAQLALAEAYLKVGRPENARDTLERLQVKEPQNPKVAELLRKCEYLPPYHLEPLPADPEGDQP
jgi:tetratricopeptide (TPR) repeat protein